MESELPSFERRVAPSTALSRECGDRDRSVGRLGEGRLRQMQRSEQRIHLDRMLVLSLVLVLGQRLVALLRILIGCRLVLFGRCRALDFDQYGSSATFRSRPGCDLSYPRHSDSVLVCGIVWIGRPIHIQWIWPVLCIEFQGTASLFLFLAVPLATIY